MTDEVFIQAIVAVAVAAVGGGGLGAWFTSRAARKRVSAEATDLITQAAHRLAGSLRDEIERLHVDLAEVRRETHACEERSDRLAAELDSVRTELREKTSVIARLSSELAALRSGRSHHPLPGT